MIGALLGWQEFMQGSYGEKLRDGTLITRETPLTSSPRRTLPIKSIISPCPTSIQADWRRIRSDFAVQADAGLTEI